VAYPTLLSGRQEVASERLILDIRYYEAYEGNSSVNPVDLGTRYYLPEETHAIGARIARKLREYGFITGVFDHVYLAYTDAIPDGEVGLPGRVVMDRFNYIGYGASPSTINTMSQEEQLVFVTDSTFRVLDQLTGGDEARLHLIDRVRQDIRKYGSELQILCRQKETASYIVTVTFQIRPKGDKSVGWVAYVDKRKQQSGKISFIELEHYQDIFYLVGSISVSKGGINLKPRTSFRASVFTRKYSVPIQVPVGQVLAT
jgi:hypothetical protein